MAGGIDTMKAEEIIYQKQIRTFDNMQRKLSIAGAKRQISNYSNF